MYNTYGFVCVCVCTCLRVRVHIYVCVNVCACIYSVHVYIHACLNLYMNTCAQANVHMCKWTPIYGANVAE